MVLPTPLQQELIEVVSQFANLLVLLDSTNADNHMFFFFSTFDGSNRSNVGSVEHDSFKGINVTEFFRNQVGAARQTNTASILSIFTKFTESRSHLTVKYGKLPYLIFQT